MGIKRKILESTRRKGRKYRIPWVVVVWSRNGTLKSSHHSFKFDHGKLSICTCQIASCGNLHFLCILFSFFFLCSILHSRSPPNTSFTLIYLDQPSSRHTHHPRPQPSSVPSPAYIPTSKSGTTSTPSTMILGEGNEQVLAL